MKADTQTKPTDPADANGVSIIESNRVAPQKLNTELPQDPAIPVLSAHPEELKVGTGTSLCIPVQILQIPQSGNNPKYLLTNE